MNDNELHVGIIMDGNGRWAQQRRLGRTAGHVQGARAVDAVVQAAADPQSGIGCLTLYAFSSDNWLRPPREVKALMRLFADYLRREVPRCVENGVQLKVIGRRDRLAAALVRRIEEAETATAAGGALTLRLAIDYSARDSLVRAAELAVRDAAEAPASADGTLDRARFRELISRAEGSDPGDLGSGPRAAVPDIDLLIRTGGEQRLSDFMLWECAYAELVFSPILWPDFGPTDLAEALAEYGRRNRRFGRVLEAAG